MALVEAGQNLALPWMGKRKKMMLVLKKMVTRWFLRKDWLAF